MKYILLYRRNNKEAYWRSKEYSYLSDLTKLLRTLFDETTVKYLEIKIERIVEDD